MNIVRATAASPLLCYHSALIWTSSLQIVNTLLTKAKAITFTLDSSVFGKDHSVTVTDVYVLDNAAADGRTRSYTAVYICVPILLVAVFVSVLVIMYYKK